MKSRQTAKERLVEQLLVDNYEKYYCLAYSYLHNEADALDVVQEGAYKAILKCETLREPAYAATWVYRIMLNEIFQLCREQKRRFTQENIHDLLHNQLIDEKALLYVDLMELNEALERLDEQERTILELRFLQGMKLDEVAKKLGLNPNTARSRLYRAMNKLKGILQD